MGFFSKLFFLKLALWFVLFFVSFKFKLQQIFVMISILFVIFTNLGKRKQGQKSAYSIFNEGFEKLPGTFSSDGIDQMLRGGTSKQEQQSTRRKGNSKQLDENMQLIAQSYRKNKSRYSNQRCYCGSEQKYKKCCMNMEQIKVQ